MTRKAWLLALIVATGCNRGTTEPPTDPTPPPTSTANETPRESPAPIKETPAPPAEPPPKKAAPPLPPPSSVDVELRKQVAALAVEQGGRWVIEEQPMAYLEGLGPKSITKVRPLLRDTDANVRRGAAFYLLEYFDPNDDAIVAAFVDALSDRDTTTRHIALQALKRLPEDKLAPAAVPLSQLLASGEEEANRGEVARMLGRLGGKAVGALPALQKAAADDPSSRVRQACLYAISKIDNAAAVEAHRRAAAKDADPGVRRTAATRLGQIPGGSAAAVDLTALLAEENDEIAAAAADSLVAFGADSVPALTKSLSAPDARQRKLALFCLGRLGPAAASATGAIEKLTKDPAMGELAAQVLRAVQSQ